MHSSIPYSPTLALMESHVHIYKIYILKDPFTNKVVYVGQTLQELDVRLRGHISDVGEINKAKSSYIISLKAKGAEPIIETVEVIMGTCFIDKALAIEREGHWVKYYIAKGAKLLNSTLKNHYNGRQYAEYLRDLKNGVKKLDYYYCGKTFGGDNVYDTNKMKADGFQLIVEVERNIDAEIEQDISETDSPFNWVRPELFMPMPSWTTEFARDLPRDEYLFDLEVDESDFELEYDEEEDDFNEEDTDNEPDCDYEITWQPATY